MKERTRWLEQVDHGKSNRAKCSQLAESGVKRHLGLFNKLVRTLMYRNMSIGETYELDMAGVKWCHVTGPAVYKNLIIIRAIGFSVSEKPAFRRLACSRTALSINRGLEIIKLSCRISSMSVDEARCSWSLAH